MKLIPKEFLDEATALSAEDLNIESLAMKLWDNYLKGVEAGKRLGRADERSRQEYPDYTGS